MRVEGLIDHVPNVREVILRAEPGSGICFKAGQFATLHIPQVPKPAMRAYSFASDERDTQSFRLIFKKIEGGLASKFVWDLKGGEILDFTGPFGRVLFKEPPTPQILFCCTGSGVAQHYSYLVSKKDQYPNLKYRLLFGVRNEDEIFFRKELDELKKTLKDFSYEFILSSPSGSDYKKGYIQHFLHEYDYKTIETTFYLCGNGEMIKAVKQHLVEKDNFDKARILAEAFD